jgi:hypothetical protein
MDLNLHGHKKGEGSKHNSYWKILVNNSKSLNELFYHIYKYKRGSNWDVTLHVLYL